jgi:hypothetical protein
MALAFGAARIDGPYTKCFTVTMLDNDAAADLAVDFNVNMTRDLAVTPISAVITDLASAAGVISCTCAITAMTTAGCTFRKLAGGGAGGAVTSLVTIRSIHSVDR